MPGRRDQAQKKGSQPAKKYRTKYTLEQLKKSVKQLWDSTARLRSQTNGMWNKAIGSLVAKEAKAKGIPTSTLKDHFKRRLVKERSLTPEATRMAAAAKKRSDERSLLSGIEKQALYDWIPFIAKRFTPPTLRGLRFQAADILEARGVIKVPDESWATRLLKYFEAHFAKDDPNLKIIKRTARSQDQQRAGVTPEQIAEYFFKLEQLCQGENIRAWLFADETGYSGFYGGGLGKTKCLSQAQYRQEVFRVVSNVRRHITILPPVLVLVNDEGGIEAIHHMPPLFVHARQQVGTKLAQAQTDPSIASRALNRIKTSRAQNKLFRKSPHGIPPPTRFKRFVAASPSGNVNSVIVYNFFKEQVIPWVRGLGVSKDDLVVLNWDRHSSHTSSELLQLLEDENLFNTFFPEHATNWLQLQDDSQGQFCKLKTESRKDINAWTIHLKRRNQTLKIEDFPFVIQQAYNKSIQEEVTKRALKNVGLFPFNPSQVLRKVPNSKSWAEYKAIFAAAAPAERENEDEDSDVEPGLGQDEEEDEEEDEEKGGALPPARSFFRTASNPLSNRSPRTSRLPGPRLRRDPNKITFTATVDVFDFAHQERQKEIAALIEQQNAATSDIATPAPRSRGRRMGKKGDVFSAADIEAQRDRVTKEKAEQRLKQKLIRRKKQQALRDAKEQVKALKAQLRAEKRAHKEETKKRKRSEKVVKKLQARLQKIDQAAAADTETSDETETESDDRDHINRRLRKRRKVNYCNADEEESEEEDEEEESEEGESDEEELLQLL
jgi:hypothetical protein